MKTISGNIKAIYEQSNPTSTIVKQRFLLRTEDNTNLFLTLFNNIHLLERFKVGDNVEVSYNTKAREAGDHVFIDHFVVRIAPEIIKKFQPLEYYENGKHNLAEYFEAILFWLKSKCKIAITIDDTEFIARKLVGKQNIPIETFHSVLQDVVRRTPQNKELNRDSLLECINEIIDEMEF